VGEAPTPWLYLIVATGNIFEDIVQARAAAEQGADIVAVIRSTGQSLLDYVPYGATTEGFGGTYATQENFRLMRAALDEVGDKLQRYIRLTNYCSGLCMPEIAAMGAMERLDMMLNDAMYGIIFRDINMKRTFIDQFFSRAINAYAGIIINTGEDNYLTTADAVEAAHTVLASQLINEQFAVLSGLQPELMGLGHAFEINPGAGKRLPVGTGACAAGAPGLPDASLKYMPPTKHMTGNIFRGHVQDALFNIVSTLTCQNIHLLGMMTEAIHTPFIQDRFLSIQNARYVFRTMRDLHAEIEFKPGGQIEQRAQQVLAAAEAMLAEVARIGLPAAIAQGRFAEISRKPDGGKGLDGVVAKADDYLNPFAGADAAGECTDPRKWIKPYGDTLDDGRVQLSFTLPVALSDDAKEAARRLALAMGLDEPAVSHAQDMGRASASTSSTASAATVWTWPACRWPSPSSRCWTRTASTRRIAQKMGRKMVVIGACIETDAHTVGIDAIMNMKGYNGHKGLESYHQIRAINMGAQVDSEDLVTRAIEERADVILVSQVVTQKNIHLDNLTRLSDILEAEGLRDAGHPGGGRPAHQPRAGQGTGLRRRLWRRQLCRNVASFAIHEWIKRQGVPGSTP
jgi:beta-lysine 5,6-aminomutase alpha subunit